MNMCVCVIYIYILNMAICSFSKQGAAFGQSPLFSCQTIGTELEGDGRSFLQKTLDTPGEKDAGSK